jgi:hypothetical protein
MVTSSALAKKTSTLRCSLKCRLSTLFLEWVEKGQAYEVLKKELGYRRFKKTELQRYDREVAQGVAGAKNVVYLNPTVQEATDNPDMLGGPVSGAALAKLKRRKGIK